MSRQCDDAGPFSSLNAGKMKGSASGMLAEPSRNRRSDEAQPQVREGVKGGACWLPLLMHRLIRRYSGVSRKSNMI